MVTNDPGRGVMPAEETRAAIADLIGSRLGLVQGRRRKRLLDAGQIMGLILEVADGKPWSWMTGGQIPVARGHRPGTTLALAARVGDRICVGIEQVTSFRAHPGAAWLCLQPWRHPAGSVMEFGRDGPRGNAEVKWRVWARQPTIIRLAGPEIDALVECRDLEAVATA
jgi:hypothetical protein